MGSISSHVLCFFSPRIDDLYHIQDSSFGTHGTDESRTPGPQRHHPAPSSRSPGRSPPQGIFHSSPARRDATTMQQRARGWTSFAENPDLIYTPGSVQTDPPHDFGVASAPLWDNDIYSPPAADGLVSHIGAFTPPTDTEYLLWSSGVYRHHSHPNHASGEANFPQNGGPLIQPDYQPHSVGLVSAVDPPQSNHIQLSRSGSQGASLIVSGDYVRSEMLAHGGCA